MRLKQLREENNLSQLDLANKLNMSQQAISAYEKGTREPDIDTIKKISDFFNVSTDYLLGKSHIRNSEAIDTDKINIGLSTKDYNPPTKEQQEKIEEFAKFVLKDNLKKKGTK